MHTCKAIVISCIDFRIQKTVEEWANENIGIRQYDRVAWAGGVQDIEGVLKQIDISVRLHSIQKAVLMNHEDCGAYGEAGTFEKHQQDLKGAAELVKGKYPSLTIEPYFVKLDGSVISTAR